MTVSANTTPCCHNSFEDGSARVLESVYREGRTAPPRDPPLTIKPAFCYLFPLGVADDVRRCRALSLSLAAR
mgnify:FL=1